MNPVAGPKELMKKTFSLSENQTNVVSVFMSFTKHLCLFALEVLFALSCEGKQPRRISFMHHDTEALPLVYLAGDQGDFDVYYPITFLPRSHCSSSSSVVLLHCRWRNATLQCIIICGSEIYLSIFLSIGSIALYICMCCFFCVKVSTLTILYIMQMIWTLCFRIYCLFCTWWLICTPTSPAPPNPYCGDFMLWWCGHIKWRNMF